MLSNIVCNFCLSLQSWLATKNVKRDILEEISEVDRANCLVPSRDFVERLMVSKQMWTAAQVEALLNHAEIARGKGRKEWLKQVAKDAKAFQFHSRA